ncbi:MAG: phosphoglycerate mutase [Clostridia bacterium]|nr:phosphoglycerate mutase [Clostridia bacterium]
MKYFILLCDGMSDKPSASLNGKTPMEAAVKPTMNMLAARSFNGLALHTPEGLEPCEDVATLSVFGYDPREYACGTPPFEAVSAGEDLQPDRTAYRLDLVTLSDGESFEERVLTDPSAGEITTEESAELISALNKVFNTKTRSLLTGIGSRHCMVWKKAPLYNGFVSARAAAGKKIGESLPQGEAGQRFVALMEKSFNILKDHPVNKKRIEQGLLPANGIWISGCGKKVAIPDFCRKWDTNASVISATDLVKGIAISANARSADVLGATGLLNSNFEGKAKAAVDEFEAGAETVIVHIEGAAEYAFKGDAEKKKQVIEKVDSAVLAPVYEYLCGCGDQFKIMVVSNRTVSSEERAAAAEPSPFFIYNSQRTEVGYKPFSEANAAKGGFCLPEGFRLLNFFIRKPGVPKAEGEEEKPEEKQKEDKHE